MTLRRQTRTAIVAAAAAVWIGGCSDTGAGAAPVQRSAPAVPVRAATVVEKDVPVQLRAIGTVEAFATVALKSRVEGQVLDVHFKEGQAVRQGDLLFTIDPRPFEAALRQAEANLARDRAQADNAHTEAERMRRLLEQRIVSQDEHDQATTRAAAMRATVAANQAAVERAELDLQYCSIRAPLDGRMGQILIDRGNVVKIDDTTLAVLNQMRPIYVAFSVPQQQLDEIRRHAADGSLLVEVRRNQTDAGPSTGRLTFIDNAVDTTTGTVLLKGEFANEDEGLWPGQFVDTVVTLAVRPKALVVPGAAVQSGQQGAYVFTIGDSGTVELRPVRVGDRLGTELVIEDGLRAGERVVTDGQILLAPGVAVEVRDDVPAATPAARAG